MQQSGSHVLYLYRILSFLGERRGGGGGVNDLEWIKDDGFPSRKVLCGVHGAFSFMLIAVLS